jgi:hypothetical protein
MNGSSPLAKRFRRYEPGELAQAEPEDDHAAGDHGEEHAQRRAVERVLGEGAGHGRGERERDQVTARGPEQLQEPGRTAGEERQAARALEQVEQLGQERARARHRCPRSSTTNPAW